MPTAPNTHEQDPDQMGAAWGGSRPRTYQQAYEAGGLLANSVADLLSGHRWTQRKRGRARYSCFAGGVQSPFLTGTVDALICYFQVSSLECA